LLTLGSWPDIVQALVIAMLGIAIISISFEGYLMRPLTLIERVIAFASGAALIFPGTASDLMGLGLGALFLLIHIRPWKAAGSPKAGTRQAS
jgi:TRAP-type uncharacterized transport system fused permease subunit